MNGSTEATDAELVEAVLRNRNAYARSRPFSPWIYRIAHNEAMSHLRRNHSEPQPLDSAGAELILERLAADDDPAENLLRKRAGHAVRAAIGDLDLKYRDVLVLRYLEENSYDEIADILHLPPGRVATLIARGLKKLKNPLELSWGKA